MAFAAECFTTAGLANLDLQFSATEVTQRRADGSASTTLVALTVASVGAAAYWVERFSMVSVQQKIQMKQEQPPANLE